MIKLSYLAAALSLAAGPVGAQTVTKTINTTGSMGTNGAYGNALLFSGSTDPSLQLRVTGWQSQQSTNSVTSAYLGAYGTGLGVTGLGDQSGGSNLHQIDNVGGYTDFLLLQFNRAVTLSSASLNLYQMGGVTGVDSDLAFWTAGALKPAQWNSSINLAAYATAPSLWTEIAGGSTGGSRTLGAGAASNVWLLGASFLPTGDRDDGFKLSQVTVTEQVAAVPEPGTWAMMMLGFAAVGAALRRTVRGARPKRELTLRSA